MVFLEKSHRDLLWSSISVYVWMIEEDHDNMSHVFSALAFPTTNLVATKYTGCNRRNGPDFGRVFLMLSYTEKPQNTYIQSSMVTEI